ncbi:alpha-L-rhamnosidase [uncultured Leifsonia sp.]|uniref:alpha-L-rhamnosidase n=1 Tax=uncultured Leifsonia sp. TaxID=340359 RepID=UPI0025CD604B|nr:alpha-L-rhamnosidase [uncultured Leifsonia sp.]
MAAHPPIVSITSVEYRRDTAFVATPEPQLTWATETDAPGWRQAWAEVESGGDVVRTEGDESVRVPWPFPPLRPREQRVVRVRVGGTDGSVSAWSGERVIRAGFLAPHEWTASMIALSESTRPGQPALLRSEFTVEKEIASATLYSTAQGVYQVEINGAAVDADTLKPGWTSYQWRLIHETQDVTGLLRPGRNAVGIELAAGWFAQRYGFGDDATTFYGDQPGAALHLVVEYRDGEVAVFDTDDDWTGFGDGPVVEAGLYAGQHEDARRERAGWSSPGFDDEGWSAVATRSAPVPEPRIAPPVREIDELRPVSVTASPSGATILDFGANIVGRLRVRAHLPNGTKLVFRHAEILSGGELDTRSMRGAAATDSFVSAGEPVVWEPRFTFRGFRYASVEGWPGELPSEAISAVVISSDLERIGWLETSDPLVNRLHDAIVRSTRGNFVSLPTDCPQRDERLGWTGDIEVFAPTAAALFDVDGFLASWLRDVAHEQAALAGIVPFIVPNVMGLFTAPTAGWGDASVGVPWTLYQRFGDRTVLERQYPSLKAWVELVAERAGEGRLWKGGFQFGDWLDPTAPKDDPTAAKADKELVATAYFYRSAGIAARTAALLGEREDAEYYERLAEEIKHAFGREYVTANGRLSSDAQAAYALAIAFGLAESPEVEHLMGVHLARLVRRNGYRIGTGFLGTPVVVEALCRTGQLEAADRLLTQTECPSWLYPIAVGATTTWEAWDALLPDGSPSPASTSFNHYAFGAIGDWLYGSLAGLSAAEPGYRTLRVAPVPLPGFTHASAVRTTPYGRASVEWERDGDEIRVRALVPPNTSATVLLPDGRDPFDVPAGHHEWTVVDGAQRRPSIDHLSMESDLADIVDDPAAYRAVLSALDTHAPHAAEALRTRTRWEEGVALGVELFILPRRTQAAIDEELRLFVPAAR